MKPRSLILHILTLYSHVIPKKFQRFLTSKVMRSLPKNGRVDMTRKNFNEILEVIYDVMVGGKYTSRDASDICRLICSKITRGINLKDCIAEFYSSFIKDASQEYKAFVMNIYLSVDSEKRIHEECITSVMVILYRAKYIENFSDDALKKTVHRLSIIT